MIQYYRRHHGSRLPKLLKVPYYIGVGLTTRRSHLLAVVDDPKPWICWLEKQKWPAHLLDLQLISDRREVREWLGQSRYDSFGIQPPCGSKAGSINRLIRQLSLNWTVFIDKPTAPLDLCEQLFKSLSPTIAGSIMRANGLTIVTSELDRVVVTAASDLFEKCKHRCLLI